ncbi:hypothetical protein FQA39_LY00933 [Lamprigera yunnana]|nr:hypothetical protein FQA39_LY00933 [Lamprigera yunnana]
MSLLRIRRLSKVSKSSVNIRVENSTDGDKCGDRNSDGERVKKCDMSVNDNTAASAQFYDNIEADSGSDEDEDLVFDTGCSNSRHAGVEYWLPSLK